METLYKWVDIKDVDLTKLDDAECFLTINSYNRVDWDYPDIVNKNKHKYKTILLPIELPEMLSDEAIDKLCPYENHDQNLIAWNEGAIYMRDLLLPLIASKEEEIKEFVKEVQKEFPEINLEYLDFAAERFINDRKENNQH